MNNMGKLFDEVEAELLKQFKAITPEQLEKDERLRTHGEIARATAGETQHGAQQTRRARDGDLDDGEPRDHGCSSGMFMRLLTSSPRRPTIPTSAPSGAIAAGVSVGRRSAAPTRRLP